MVGSSWIWPRSGSNWSRNTGFPPGRQTALSSSRSSLAMRSKASGKWRRIMFQYPMPPWGQPMQLAFWNPSLYMAGSSMPAPTSASRHIVLVYPWVMRGVTRFTSGLALRNLSARFCSSAVYPNTWMSVGSSYCCRRRFLSSTVHRVPPGPTRNRVLSNTSHGSLYVSDFMTLISTLSHACTSWRNLILSGCSPPGSV